MSSKPDTTESSRTRPRVASLWGWPIATGVIMALLGAAAISSSTLTGLIAIVMIGAALGTAGIVEIATSLGIGDKRVQPLRLLGGILSVVVGFLFVARPATALVALTVLLLAYFMANGLFHIVTSLAQRYPKWGWDAAYGLCALVLGVIVLLNLRTAGITLLGTLVGIEIFLRGTALMAVGIVMRRERKATAST